MPLCCSPVCPSVLLLADVSKLGGPPSLTRSKAKIEVQQRTTHDRVAQDTISALIQKSMLPCSVRG